MAKNQKNRKGNSSTLMDLALERPVATAAAAAGAVATGVFLWSKRAQISDQLSQLSDQIGEWTDNMGTYRSNPELEIVSEDASSKRSGAGNTNRSRGSTASRRPASNRNPVSADDVLQPAGGRDQITA